MLVIFSTANRLAILTKVGVVVSGYPDVSIEFASTVEELITFLPAASAVFSMGSPALTLLQGLGYVPKNRKITGLRRQVLHIDSTPLMVSYSPSISDIDHGQFVDLLTDTALVFRLAKTGTTAPQYGDYTYTLNLKEIVASVRKLVAEKGHVNLAFDTETLGLDRYSPEGYIVGLQFSFKPGTGYMVVFTSRAQCLSFLHDLRNQEDLHYLLNCQEISLRAANGKYDLEWLYETCGITCTNFRFDTTLVGSLLEENRSNALDVHVKIYAPSLSGYSDKFDQEADKSRMDLEYLKDPQAFLNYSAGDADGVLQVAEAQKTELMKNEGLTRFYVNLLHPAARAFEIVEQGGVVVDKNEFDQLEADLISDMHRLIGKGKAVIGGVLAAKHYDPDKQGGINLTKASLITDFMFSPAGLNLKPKMRTEKTKAPVTSMEHLQMFKDVPEAKEFISLMNEFSNTTKTLSTYVVGFKKHLRSDGRFHPVHFLFKGDHDEGEGGTVTGRLSAREPAIQTLPKHTFWGKRIRKCYTAPPGMFVVEEDYSQGELKVIACISQETNMINAYLKGLDLHVVTSSGVAGLTYEQMMALKKTDKERYDEIRQLGKAGNFGLSLADSVCLTRSTVDGTMALILLSKIKLYHQLWDGLDWVNHDGVITQGEYYCITWDGVTATPDHKVWTADGRKVELQKALKEGAKLARTATVSGEQIVWEFDDSTRVDCHRVQPHDTNVLLGLSESQRGASSESVSGGNQELHMSQGGQVPGGEFGLCKNFRGEVRLYCATLQQGLAQAIKRLQRKGNQVLVRFAGALCSLGFGEVAGYGFQGVGIRQGGQQGPLFSRQSETANQFTKSPQHGSQCQDNVPRQGNVLDGLAQPIRTEENPVVRFTRINGRRDNSASIELSKRPAQELEGLGIKTEKVRVYANRPFTRWLTNASSKIQRGNYCEEAGNSGEELTPEERFVLVNGGRDNSSHKEANRVQAEALVKLGLQVKKCKVYDILNAGPRRRFTCNGKLVSNCFGMSVDGFIEYARTSYGVALTYEQAEKIRNTFFESYPQLLVYHRVYKAYAHKHEQVVSPLGRIRHLPLINSKLREVQAKEERRSINSPVQSTLTDMMIWSIALQHQRGWLEKTPVFGVIHDAQYLYVPQDNHEHYIKRSKEVMENLPFEQLGWAPQLKFTADAKFGTSMGDLS